MDVPTEEERCVATKSDRADEGVPCWIEEEFDERDDLEEEREEEGSASTDFR